MHLATAVGLRGQLHFHFGVADVDPALGQGLAQALDGEFVAQLFAETAETHAVCGELGPHVVDADAVLLGNAADGLVQFGVADADAVVLGAGDLQAHQDQAVQHLPFQHIGGRQCVFLAAVLGADVGHGLVQFAAQDHVLVNHRDDAVDRRRRQRLRVQ